MEKKNQAFKRCSGCGYEWDTPEAFLADPTVELVGYQVNFGELGLGFFLFNHLACRTTIAIKANRFRNLYAGPVYVERLTDTEECPGYCLHREELEPCPARCECAYVREVIQIIRGWHKDTLLVR
jgi:hypothetical protein